MTEMIGKVTLDYSAYSGEDLYSDGEVEDELLEIVRGRSKVEYQSIIEERKSWPILYHLSEQRQNIIEWLPLEGKKVLEVGSGCGAITGMLAEKASRVTCVELSKKRSLINANRNSDYGNITIRVGNFTDIEPELEQDFDYILLIGVFEYARGYIGGDTPYEDFLRILYRHLKSDGRMIIAIENKYGLKYFAGCREDHIGSYFGGIENYTEEGVARTFGRKGLEQIFRKVGVKEYHFYYPYPDYKFMTTLYSDDYKPRKGELSNNLRNFDRDRMVIFDEKSAFDGIVEEDLFDVFSNSYLVVLGGGFDTEYVRYSNDRAEEFCIRTEIAHDRNHKRFVTKRPLSESAYGHVEKLVEAHDKLAQRYRDSKLDINTCRLYRYDGVPCAEFEYIEGKSLAELFDGYLERNDQEGFHALFREYFERIGYHSEEPVADLDPVFSNIMVRGDRWTLIDYEWTFDRQTDTRELAFRAIYCYLLESEKRNVLDFDRVLSEIGIRDEEAEEFREKELEFQKFVLGRKESMSDIRNSIRKEFHILKDWIQEHEAARGGDRVQIFENTGEGFSEEQSYYLWEPSREDQGISFELHVPGDVKLLRIDPSRYSCMVRIKELTLNGIRIPVEQKGILSSNGLISKPHKKEAYQPCILFDREDPNIVLDLGGLVKSEENQVNVSMEIVKMPEKTAERMKKKFLKIF